MPDREKVIRAVDSCFDYWLDQHRYLQPSELEIVRRRKAEALALLKEQETVEPNVAFTRVNGTKAFSCPRCSALIYGGSYCSHCGQALKGGEL